METLLTESMISGFSSSALQLGSCFRKRSSETAGKFPPKRYAAGGTRISRLIRWTPSAETIEEGYSLWGDSRPGCPPGAAWHCSQSLLFDLQQRLLALHSPAIAADVAIFADHAMAWNRNRHRICRTGAGYCAACSWRANRLSHLTVSPRLAERNRLQISPYPPLKGSGADIQGQ